MKVLSLWQPYLAGVLHGDGWCTPLTIGLRVKDRDFAEAFAAALQRGFAVGAVREYRGYWEVRISNKTGRFSQIRTYLPSTSSERGAWLRGFFDSEGNAHLSPARGCERGWNRRIAMFSTDADTIAVARGYLADLGMSTATRVRKRTTGHLGTKPVFELKLRGSVENYSLFADHVGSSISRKAVTIEAIARTYDDVADKLRAAQAKGASTKRARRQAREAA